MVSLSNTLLCIPDAILVLGPKNLKIPVSDTPTHERPPPPSLATGIEQPLRRSHVWLSNDMDILKSKLTNNDNITLLFQSLAQ